MKALKYQVIIGGAMLGALVFLGACGECGDAVMVVRHSDVSCVDGGICNAYCPPANSQLMSRRKCDVFAVDGGGTLIQCWYNWDCQ